MSVTSVAPTDEGLADGGAPGKDISVLRRRTGTPDTWWPTGVSTCNCMRCVHPRGGAPARGNAERSSRTFRATGLQTRAMPDPALGVASRPGLDPIPCRTATPTKRAWPTRDPCTGCRRQRPSFRCRIRTTCRGRRKIPVRPPTRPEWGCHPPACRCHAECPWAPDPPSATPSSITRKAPPGRSLTKRSPSDRRGHRRSLTPVPGLTGVATSSTVLGRRTTVTPTRPHPARAEIGRARCIELQTGHWRRGSTPSRWGPQGVRSPNAAQPTPTPGWERRRSQAVAPWAAEVAPCKRTT